MVHFMYSFKFSIHFMLILIHRMSIQTNVLSFSNVCCFSISLSTCKDHTGKDVLQKPANQISSIYLANGCNDKLLILGNLSDIKNTHTWYPQEWSRGVQRILNPNSLVSDTRAHTNAQTIEPICLRRPWRHMHAYTKWMSETYVERLIGNEIKIFWPHWKWIADVCNDTCTYTCMYQGTRIEMIAEQTNEQQ